MSSLFHGDLDSAETYLQLAARWAQPNETQHQVTALSNLGVYPYMLFFELLLSMGLIGFYERTTIKSRLQSCTFTRWIPFYTNNLLSVYFVAIQVC